MNIPTTDYNQGLYSALLRFENKRAQNEGLNIQNQLKRPRIQYAPQMAKAEHEMALANLLNRNITNEWLPKQNQSSLNFEGAKTTGQNLENEFLPQKYQEAINSEKAYQQAQFSKARGAGATTGIGAPGQGGLRNMPKAYKNLYAQLRLEGLRDDQIAQAFTPSLANKTDYQNAPQNMYGMPMQINENQARSMGAKIGTVGTPIGDELQRPLHPPMQGRPDLREALTSQIPQQQQNIQSVQNTAQNGSEQPINQGQQQPAPQNQGQQQPYDPTGWDPSMPITREALIDLKEGAKAGLAAEMLKQRDPTGFLLKKAVNIGTIKNTIAQVPTEVFNDYVGIEGRMRYYNDLRKSLSPKSFGIKVPERFVKFNQFMKVQGPSLAKETRQAWGDSIQPAMMERIEKMMNPDVWASPEVAIGNFVGYVNEMEGIAKGWGDILQEPGSLLKALQPTHTDKWEKVIKNFGQEAPSNRATEIPESAKNAVVDRAPATMFSKQNIESVMKKYKLGESDAVEYLKSIKEQQYGEKGELQ